MTHEQPDLFSSEPEGIAAEAAALFKRLDALDGKQKVEAINQIRLALAEHSPYRDEPVDCVLWVEADRVAGNAYNPNVVAPPQMRLLEKSVAESGFTQPIVAWTDSDGADYEVVDGFHRHQVATSTTLDGKLAGRLPVAVIRPERTELEDRMAATIQHNAARGRHTVDGLAEMVLDLHRQKKSDAWICANLGMDLDEVLRLRQTQGLAEAFADEEFSEAWEPQAFEDGGDDAESPPLS